MNAAVKKQKSDLRKNIKTSFTGSTELKGKSAELRE